MNFQQFFKKSFIISNMKISVVIPAYNEEKYIGKCLESIANQIEKPSEIIVVDNNCTDKTIEIAKSFNNVTIVKEEKQGMIFARNAGFDSAKYEILARTDVDTILPPDWISKIKEDFKDPDLGGLSGPTSYFKTPLMSDISRSVVLLYFYIVGLMIGNTPLLGPNMAIRKSLWEKIKKDVCLDDHKVHEDIDLSIHLAKIAKIKIDKNLTIRTLRGRWSKLLTEYIVRLIKMTVSHRKFLL